MDLLSRRAALKAFIGAPLALKASISPAVAQPAAPSPGYFELHVLNDLLRPQRQYVATFVGQAFDFDLGDPFVIEDSRMGIRFEGVIKGLRILDDYRAQYRISINEIVFTQPE